MKWNVTLEDSKLIAAIVERAVTQVNARIDRQYLNMDITATHLNGCPLDLQGLLTAERFEFVHDISGIMHNINRNTGKLLSCFTPRYTA